MDIGQTGNPQLSEVTTNFTHSAAQPRSDSCARLGKRVTVLVPEHQFEAEIVRGRLESAGIKAGLSRRSVGGWTGTMGFRGLPVRRMDAAKGQSLNSERIEIRNFLRNACA
jgi:hypothetical protein